MYGLVRLINTSMPVFLSVLVVLFLHDKPGIVSFSCKLMRTGAAAVDLATAVVVLAAAVVVLADAVVILADAIVLTLAAAGCFFNDKHLPPTFWG